PAGVAEDGDRRALAAGFVGGDMASQPVGVGDRVVAEEGDESAARRPHAGVARGRRSLVVLGEHDEIEGPAVSTQEPTRGVARAAATPPLARISPSPTGAPRTSWRCS